MNDFLTLDFETRLFAPGCMAPVPIVLATDDGLHVGDDMRRAFESVLDDTREIVGHYVAYDMAVAMQAWPDLTERIFAAYDAGRIVDTRIVEKLIDIANGRHRAQGRKYSLEDIARRRLGVTLDKDTWRLRYAELEQVPLALWPEGAKAYALGDVATTRALMFDQQARAKKIDYDLPDLAAQCRASFALHLMGAWGVQVDGEYIERFKAAIGAKRRALAARLVSSGLMDSKGKKSNKALQAIVLKELGTDAPRTAKGAVQIDAAALERLSDPAAVTWREYVGLEKIEGTYLDPMAEGAGAPIHARWNELVDSGRTSCATPNLQNPPRGSVELAGETFSVRGCIVPRPGYVFASCDYDGAELHALAQACVTITGKSRLAQRYREDPAFDPHLEFAASMENVSYADAMTRKKAGDEKIIASRQRAKAAMFGFPGGLGATRFVDYAKGYGLTLTVGQATAIRERWFQAWPEMRDYFHLVSSMSNSGGDFTQLVSDRRRGGCGYTDGANTLFQGLTADYAKAALYEVAKRAYTDDTSLLYGCRPVLFLHDEIIIEAPEWKASEAADELARVMVETADRYMPDVPSRASAHLMRRWNKQAKPTRDASGRLIVWEDHATV